MKVQRASAPPLKEGSNRVSLLVPTLSAVKVGWEELGARAKLSYTQV